VTLAEALAAIGAKLTEQLLTQAGDIDCPSCGVGSVRGVCGAVVVEVVLRDGVRVCQRREPLIISCDFCTWTREVSAPAPS
jgi:hypothetical protein